MKKRILTALLAVCLVLTLVPLTVFADAGVSSEPSLITTVGVCGTWIDSGNYYVSDGKFGLKRAAANTVPTSGFVIYDRATAKLTINNIELRQNAGEPCLRINNAELPTQNTYVDMTLEVVGTTALKALGEGRGLNIENVHLNIIGDGSLYVSCAKDYAIYARSLTVSSAVKLTAVANKAGGQTKAISTVGDILFKNGTVVAEAQGAGSTSAAILSSDGNITVEGTADVTAKGDYYGVNCARGTFFVKGGKFSAETLNGDAVWAKNIAVSGGTVNILKSPAGALAASEGVTVSGNAELKIKTDYTNIYSEEKNITVSGGKLNLTSNYGNCMYTNADYNGKISITGGTITAVSESVTLWGNGIEIENATLNLKAINEVAIYSPVKIEIKSGNFNVNAEWSAVMSKDIVIGGGDITAVSSKDNSVRAINNLDITGGVLAAGAKTEDKFSVYAGNTLKIDGDTVVYGDKIGAKTLLNTAEGVVYKNTEVGFDNDGKRVLSGGYGTVYGNPNVTEFTKPTDSSLGTDFDEYVTVNSKAFEYTGKRAEPKAEVKVNKIALTKTLTQGSDYTVEVDNNAVNVGEHGGKIKAVESSGNVGTLDFDFDITPKKLEWDLSDINVSKTEDGTNSAAKVEGTVKLKGICGEDDVTLIYDSVKAADFPDAKAGEYSVKLSLENADITGESAGNYTLPESDITVTAQIKSLITDDNKDSADSNISQLPKNGDGSHLLLGFALLAVSGGVLAILAIIAFKKKTESAKQ